MKRYIELCVSGRKNCLNLRATATVGMVEPDGRLYMAGDVFHAALRCVGQIETIAIHTFSDDPDEGGRLRTMIYGVDGCDGKRSLEVRNYASDGRSTAICTLSGTWRQVTLMAIRNLREVSQHIRAGDRISPL